MEASSIVALMVILGFGYWINQRAKDKSEQDARKEAQNDLAKVREEAKATIHSRAMKFGIDYTDNQLDWICDNAQAHFGKEGIAKIEHMFETAPKEKLEELMMKIEVQHMEYLAEQNATKLSDESARRWQAILSDFKKLNPAQQKTHLAYIKKHSNELNDEQLHILELISLGNYSGPAETDIMLGNTKLFSVRRKQ